MDGSHLYNSHFEDADNLDDNPHWPEVKCIRCGITIQEAAEQLAVELRQRIAGKVN